jgi:hypothetical protein
VEKSPSLYFPKNPGFQIFTEDTKKFVFLTGSGWGGGVRNFFFFSSIVFIRYFLYLHFKCYPLSWFPFWKSLPSLPLLINPPTFDSWPWHYPTLGHRAFIEQRASIPIDDLEGHPLLHMQLEPWVPPSVLFALWFNPWYLWGYKLVHILVPPMGIQTPSAPWVLSLVPLNDPVLSPMVGREHLPMHFSGTGRTPQETAISGSCQQALFGIHSNVCIWWLYMGRIPRWGSLWMTFPSVSAPHFCLCIIR